MYFFSAWCKGLPSDNFIIPIIKELRMEEVDFDSNFMFDSESKFMFANKVNFGSNPVDNVVFDAKLHILFRVFAV